jgi:hypothetical protein
MRKCVVLTGLFLLFFSNLFANAAKAFPCISMQSLSQNSFISGATIENGLTLLLMMSAFYMIAKNFMLQEKVSQFKEKVRGVFETLRIH